MTNKQNKQTTFLNKYLLAHQKTLVEIEPIHGKSDGQKVGCGGLKEGWDVSSWTNKDSNIWNVLLTFGRQRVFLSYVKPTLESVGASQPLLRRVGFMALCLSDTISRRRKVAACQGI